MGCFKSDLSFFSMPTLEKHWPLAVNKPGEWFMVEEAAEKFMKRWFVLDKEQVAT